MSCQHATCNMQHATCNMQHATCNMQHATCNMQHATCNMQHATCQHVNMQYKYLIINLASRAGLLKSWDSIGELSSHSSCERICEGKKEHERVPRAGHAMVHSPIWRARECDLKNTKNPPGTSAAMPHNVRIRQSFLTPLSTSSA